MSINFSHLSVCKSTSDFNKHELELNQLLHDIKSPLSTLNLCMSHIEKTNQHSSADEAVVILKMALERISGLVTKKKLNVGFSLSRSLTEIISEIKYSDIISIDLNYVPEHIENILLSGVADDFKNIIQNVVNNSVNAHSTKLIFNVTDLNEFIQIKISDNGHGIDKKLMPYIGKTGISFIDGAESKGQGLGLSNAVQIIRSWGGDLKIDSRIETGTSITILIAKS